jgi:hypothetical protein
MLAACGAMGKAHRRAKNGGARAASGWSGRLASHAQGRARNVRSDARARTNPFGARASAHAVGGSARARVHRGAHHERLVALAVVRHLNGHVPSGRRSVGGRGEQLELLLVLKHVHRPERVRRRLGHGVKPRERQPELLL